MDTLFSTYYALLVFEISENHLFLLFLWFALYEGGQERIYYSAEDIYASNLVSPNIMFSFFKKKSFSVLVL